MNETERKFKFIPRTCIYRGKKEKCPMEEGLEFTARVDGKDTYLVTYINYLGIILARCPICSSHKQVQEVNPSSPSLPNDVINK